MDVRALQSAFKLSSFIQIKDIVVLPAEQFILIKSLGLSGNNCQWVCERGEEWQGPVGPTFPCRIGIYIVYINPIFLETIKNSSQFPKDQVPKVHSSKIKLNAIAGFSGQSDFSKQNFKNLFNMIPIILVLRSHQNV